MTPLDDSLRETLAARAASLTPSPDPLAGIETRAGRIRRRRAGVAAGAALAVAAIALAVPALGSSGPHRMQPASRATPPANAMLQTPDDRGEPVTPGSSPVVDAWAKAHPGRDAVYRITLVDGHSGALGYQLLELWRSSGPAFVVVAQDVSHPVLVRDEQVTPGVAFLDGVVGGNGVGPFVVFALADGVTSIAYDAGDGRLPTPAPFPSAGANGGMFDRTGPGPGTADTLTATYHDGRTTTEVVTAGPYGARAPANVLDWVARGTSTSGPSTAALVTTYAQQRGSSPEKVTYRALCTGVSGDVRYTVGQAWVVGDEGATTVTYSEGGASGSQLFEHGFASPEAAVVAGWVPVPSGELLVLVPRPGIGQVLYSAGSAGAFHAVANGRSDLDGIALVDRASGNTQDRVEVLDGDGNTDRPLFVGSVAGLLHLPVS